MITNEKTLLLLILACGLVTWIPRILPFIITKNMTFSDFWRRFMTYIPMCILTALFFQSLLVIREGQLTGVNLENLVVSIPTIIVGFVTKSLMWTVVFGIAMMMVVRYLSLF